MRDVHSTSRQPDTTELQPQGAKFSLVFSSVLGITVLCLGVAIYLVERPQSDAIRSLTDKVIAVFTLGCGAIFGLLGGKALR